MMRYPCNDAIRAGAGQPSGGGGAAAHPRAATRPTHVECSDMSTRAFEYTMVVAGSSTAVMVSSK